MKIEEHILKVEEHYVASAYKEKVFSRIRLKGKWLMEAGFEPDDRVLVSVLDEGKIVLTKTD